MVNHHGTTIWENSCFKIVPSIKQANLRFGLVNCFGLHPNIFSKNKPGLINGLSKTKSSPCWWLLILIFCIGKTINNHRSKRMAIEQQGCFSLLGKSVHIWRCLPPQNNNVPAAGAWHFIGDTSSFMVVSPL